MHQITDHPYFCPQALLHKARLSRHYILPQELGPQEKYALLSSWKDNHMADFNTWVQLVNCQATYHFQELDHLNHLVNQHTYQCKLTLLF